MGDDWGFEKKESGEVLLNYSQQGLSKNWVEQINVDIEQLRKKFK